MADPRDGSEAPGGASPDAGATPDGGLSSEALAAAVADALRQVGVGDAHESFGGGGRREAAAAADRFVGPDRTWVLVAAAIAGAFVAGLGGVVLGIALAGYLAAPNRAVEVAGAAIALLGALRAARRGARAVRSRSLRFAGGAALDAALALSAAALAAGMRP